MRGGPPFLADVVRDLLYGETEDIYLHRSHISLSQPLPLTPDEPHARAVPPPPLEVAADPGADLLREMAALLEGCGFQEDDCKILEDDCKPATTVDNVHSYSKSKAPPRPSGNSEEAALRRLSKDRPDLHARVIAGEMSAHAAMIEAGFRARAITVPMDVERAADVLARNFQGETSRLIEAIQEITAES